MYVMYIVIFCRYTNYVCVSHIVRGNHMVECDVALIMRTPPICVTKVFLGTDKTHISS
jgi:hypothetical protein